MLRSVSDIVAASWELYIRYFRKFLPLVIIILLPQPVLALLGIGGLYLSQVTLIFNELANIVILISIPILLIFYCWAILAVTRLSYAAYHNQALNWRSALKTTAKRIIPSILTLALVLILIFTGTLLLFVPGLIFLVWYTFVSNVLVVEEKSGLKALKASKQLVVGRFFAVAWRVLVPWAVFIIIGTLVQVGLSILVSSLVYSNAIQKIIENNLSAIISAFLAPLTALASMILYEDLKTIPLETTK